MNMTILDFGAIFSRAYAIAMERMLDLAKVFGVYIVIQLVLVVMSGVLQGLGAYFEEQVMVMIGITVVSLVLSLVRFVVNTVLMLGLARVFLNAVRGEEISVGVFLGQTDHLMGGLVAALIQSVVVLIGTCFCLIPGLIASAATGFWTLAMVDDACGPIEALAESWRLAQEVLLVLTIFGVVSTIAGLFIAFFTCGLGLLAFIPVWGVAFALIYERLREAI